MPFQVSNNLSINLNINQSGSNKYEGSNNELTRVSWWNFGVDKNLNPFSRETVFARLLAHYFCARFHITTVNVGFVWGKVIKQVQFVWEMSLNEVCVVLLFGFEQILTI